MIPKEVFKFFADLIYDRSGMVYLEKDYYRLESRIKDMVKLFEVEDTQALYWLFKEKITPDMEAVLNNISTNNETFFFRDIKPFKTLTNFVLPELEKVYPNDPLKIWSCACSSGQEPYSILMSIDSDLPPKNFQLTSVDASDISKKILEKAKSGIYNGLDVQRGLPIDLLMKYFTQLETGDWQIAKKIMNKVLFSEFNLLTGNYPANKYHIIFCRNVLIYQDVKNKSDVINHIYSALKPGGYMFLGNGESLISIESDFKRVTFEGMTIYQKEKKATL